MRPPGFEDDEFLLVLCAVIFVAGLLIAADAARDVWNAMRHTGTP